MAYTKRESAETKTCTECAQVKLVAFFPKSKRHKYGVRSTCWDCYRERHLAYQRKWRERPSSKRKISANRLKIRYGISDEQYSEMLVRQSGRCAVCLSAPSSRNLHVDHDHRTGAVRGLLCVHCNVALGNLGDDPEILVRMIEYLEGR